MKAIKLIMATRKAKLWVYMAKGLKFENVWWMKKIYAANDEMFNGKCVQYERKRMASKERNRWEKLIVNASMSEKYTTKTHENTHTLTVLFSTILSLHSVFVLMIVIIVDSMNAIHIIGV